MTHAIRKYTGRTFHERLVIKTFEHREDMNKFLNRGDNANYWAERHYTMPTEAGTYVMVAGRWKDIKTVDRTLLAHF